MTITDYQEFLQSKTKRQTNAGHEVALEDIHPALFQFQRDIVRWAVSKGRAAIFADTGLGKTLMQAEWTRHFGGKRLIVAPLGVTIQTPKEAMHHLGLEVRYVVSSKEMDSDGVYITNYE